ncbi:MAG: 3-dehydroquinate synthase [Pseudomonadota bacterium]|nr:3-dehydroquinate synthase [Pseudomonadota bacterium]
MSEEITVELGARRYPIHVGAGLIGQAGALLAPIAKGIVPVVTDSHVAALHLQPLQASLKAAGIEARPIVLPPGEATKSFGELERLCDALLDLEVDRGGLIVALGGGVIGDLVGFAAGILKRGVDFAQVPTTLLAQVDSSVGGKTAISVKQGKNLIGLFHQPRLVIADIATLATLPRRELLAGYAEVAKYGALGDAGFFAWLEANAAKALAGDEAALSHLVAHSCRMKAAVVARDERETGERALLNLGHTFGHGLEAATGYSDRLLHGEGVAIGMVLALRLSERLGLSPAADTARLIAHLKSVGLPTAVSDIPGPLPDADTLLAHMAHDKKAKDRRIVFVLAKGLGKTFTTAEVPAETLRAILAA